MGFEGRKKKKYEEAERFVEKMKEIQEEAKAALRKAQENMKKYADRKRVEVDEYKVGDLVMLSIKDLKYQMMEENREVDREVHRPLQDTENSIIECSKAGITEYSKNTSSNKY